MTEILILKTIVITSIHLHTKNTKKKNEKKTATIVSAPTGLHFALNIGGISAKAHMLLFVICFSS
jgi:hypothetical protein